ncbi:MAG: ribonuclease BN (tRNA processing enzyme) [Planctomycetota bacterium]|jgi:ribonuclease BN (tRNA processing enzyme)
MVSPSSSVKGEIRVRLLPSAVGGRPELQYANTFLINDAVAIDAGSLGFNGSPGQQSEVREILLTHSHADHIASLPMLLINDYEPGRVPIRVWASEACEASLRKHVFNDEIWPDLDRISTPEEPFIRWARIEPDVPIEVGGLRFTPIAVEHTVPTVAFLVEAEGVSIVIGGDSGPTTRLWERARELSALRAVFLETSFSDEDAELARVSGHLRPKTFAAEVAKMPAGTPFYSVHAKPTHVDLIREQLMALQLPNLHIVTPGQEYVF